MTNKPPIWFTQEIRFAVVMYGGSSLCIYMNGVAQELLRLVRATAPDPDTGNEAFLPDGSDKLGGSGQVYRKIGQMLCHGDTSLKIPDNNSIQTRFVIDVLSGTSAGGINAVYLAKALANDQDLESLKKLWIETADMDVLMNDNHSSEKVPLAAQKQPRSLLNSRLMYYLLLDSLGDMDRQKDFSGGESTNSPYVNELDLYVTATDIVGRKIRLRLADTIAHERRHLNMFHFHYSDEQISDDEENDFKVGNNPFLAFAARCTSAHPVPFEPVTLSDIDEALIKLNLNSRSNNEDWQTFYEEYLQPDIDVSDPAQGGEDAVTTRKRLAEEFRIRPFNDGGILDNSPFSFAIDSLQFRQSNFPVDRKLLYIEPVPEHPELEVDSMIKPDALTTGLLSLSVLPRYQFIREDLERILERNRLVERVQRILNGIERDEIERLNRLRIELKRKQTEVGKHPGEETADEESALTDAAASAKRQGSLSSYEFGKRNIQDMIELMGSSWGGYQRLRVAETTDELVEMIARAGGYNDKSDEILAISYLVRTWRAQNYHPYGKGRKEPVTIEGQGIDNEENKKETENTFLFKYDLKWRIRRLKFVLKKIYEISYFDKSKKEAASIAKHLDITAGLEEKEASNLVEKLNKTPEFHKELREIEKRLSVVLRSLLIERRKLLSRATARKATGSASHKKGNPLASAVEDLGIKSVDILSILQLPTDKAREERAKQILSDVSFKTFEEALEKALSTPMVRASVLVKGDKDHLVTGILEVNNSLDGPAAADTSNLSSEQLARHILTYYYNNFDRFDMNSYPILYASNVGEEVDSVEVFRISPEDAGNLVTDMKDRKRKLAGTSLGNFGAFFEKEFRRNDILWGRLDAAERIITALFSSVPETDQNKRDLLKSELIMDAQRAILAEELSAEEKSGLRGLLGSALAETKSEADNIAFLELLNEKLTIEPPNLSRVREFLNVCLTGTDPLIHFRDTHQFKHDMKPDVMIRLASRAGKVFGKMLEGMADTRRIEKKRLVWVTRITHLFWGLVEVAVPGSYGNLIYRYWLKLLYVFEILLFVLGTLLINPWIQKFGLTTFGITLVINILVLVLKDVMLNRYTVLRIVGSLAFISILIFAVIGAAHVAGFEALQWVGAKLNPIVGWFTKFLPQTLATRSPQLLPFFLLVAIVILLNVAVVMIDTLKRPWYWIRRKITESIPDFKEITIVGLEKGKITKAVQVDGKSDAFVFPFRLSSKPPPEWVENFRRQLTKSKSVARARIDGPEILLTSAHAGLTRVIPQVEEAVTYANQICIQARLDAKQKEETRKQEAEAEKNKRNEQTKINDKALADVSRYLNK